MQRFCRNNLFAFLEAKQGWGSLGSRGMGGRCRPLLSTPTRVVQSENSSNRAQCSCQPVDVKLFAQPSPEWCCKAKLPQRPNISVPMQQQAGQSLRSSNAPDLLSRNNSSTPEHIATLSANWELICNHSDLGSLTLLRWGNHARYRWHPSCHKPTWR